MWYSARRMNWEGTKREGRRRDHGNAPDAAADPGSSGKAAKPGDSATPVRRAARRRRAWAGETVWILGASSGIGRALAEELAAAGARLILSSRESPRFQDVVEACARVTPTQAAPVDLGDPAAAEGLAARLFAPGTGNVAGRGNAAGAGVGVGLPTMVIYAAGVSQRSRLAETEGAVVDRVMNVNFRSALAVTREAGRAFAAVGAGRIVVLSSLAAYAPTPFRGVYSAAKSALGVAATTLRAELAEAGVQVTLAVPGFVRTEISASALRGDGSAHGVTDPNQATGMDAGRCARVILRGVERGRDEVWVAMGVRGRIAVALGRLAPRLQRRLLARVPTTTVES